MKQKMVMKVKNAALVSIPKTSLMNLVSIIIKIIIINTYVSTINPQAIANTCSTLILNITDVVHDIKMIFQGIYESNSYLCFYLNL